ncbi:MAG: hypothetical protein VKK04_12535 [Synechococcales bacterium]|nr:hypothetical protein [Synechococcales bacterium]
MSDTPIRQTPNHPKSKSDKPEMELDHPEEGVNVEDHADDRTVDPRDIVYKQGTLENPQEVIQNPAVAPQMLEEVQEREF